MVPTFLSERKLMEFVSNIAKLKEKFLYTADFCILLIYKILILEAVEDLKRQFCSLVISTLVLLILWASCSSSIKKIH